MAPTCMSDLGMTDYQTPCTAAPESRLRAVDNPEPVETVKLDLYDN